MSHCEICNCQLNTDFVSNDAGDFCLGCENQLYIDGALNAGIPLTVIEGKTKLLDHFSQEYINKMINKKD